MRPFMMPKESCRNFAAGARQLVVQEAFEIIECFLGSYLSLFTPMHIVMSSSLAGADMMTFFAPAVRWAAALALFVDRPVPSRALSTLRSFQGSLAGSLSAVTFISFPFSTIELPFTDISAGIFSKDESYLNKWGRGGGAGKSFIWTKTQFF